MADKSLSPEIIKLMDKIAENPNSRLFVPLAEEYLNNDMPDEAILVLNEGIEKHPTYVAARIMLGKIYLGKNRIVEAKSEFERVIEINPDNILAHKKLAVIYQEEGEPHRAVDAYRQILSVDPSDKESKTLLAALEEEIPSTAVAEEAPAPLPGDESAFEIEKAPSLASSEEVFGVAEDVIAPDTDTGLDTVEPLSFGSDSDEAAGTAPEENVVELGDEPGFEMGEQWQAEPISQDDEGRNDIPLEVSSPGPEPLAETDAKETPATNSLAALYIDQGCYQEAADIYKACLERDPTDQESKAGLEKALLKLSGEATGEPVPSPDLTVETEGKATEKSQTERLQLWLDAIQKNRKRIKKDKR